MPCTREEFIGTPAPKGSWEGPCGYALNGIKPHDPYSHSRWRRGEFSSLCGRTAVLLVITTNGVYRYCTSCFVVDMEVVCKSEMVLLLSTWSDAERASLLQQDPYLNPKSIDKWMLAEDFARSACSWEAWSRFIGQ